MDGGISDKLQLEHEFFTNYIFAKICQWGLLVRIYISFIAICGFECLSVCLFICGIMVKQQTQISLELVRSGHGQSRKNTFLFGMKSTKGHERSKVNELQKKFMLFVLKEYPDDSFIWLEG